MMGAPLGNQNAVKAKRWQQAIDRALERRSKSDQIAELDRLADQFLSAVEAEGIAGYRELADRLDGKAVQTLAGDNDSPLTVQIIKHADDHTPE